MNKITILNQGCGNNPTLGSVEPGTIFQFAGESGKISENWRMKTNKECYVRLYNGHQYDAPDLDKVIVLSTSSICIEPQ